MLLLYVNVNVISIGQGYNTEGSIWDSDWKRSTNKEKAKKDADNRKERDYTYYVGGANGMQSKFMIVAYNSNIF